MTDRHESSCSVYNMPAYTNGPCDCKWKDVNERDVFLIIESGEAGLFYGTSPDERGLLVAGQSYDDVIQKAPQAIDELRSVRASDSSLDKAVEAIRLSDQ